MTEQPWPIWDAAKGRYLRGDELVNQEKRLDLHPDLPQDILDRWHADVKRLVAQGDEADWSELEMVGTHGHRYEADKQRNEARRQKCLQTKPHLYKKSRP